MKIVEFSLKRRVTVSMMVVVLALFGILSFNELGLDMLPDVEAPYISIITDYAGVSSEDIEDNITRPLEQWVSTISRVKEIKSISQEGRSLMLVEFESGTNLDFAGQDIREKIGIYEHFLPDGAGKPLVMKFNLADMPILLYGITGGKRDLKRLKNYIDTEVATHLERLEGVASAMVLSPEEGEILVNVDKGKLEARGLSIRQVEQAVQASNINLPSGYIDKSHKEYLIRTVGEFPNVAAIRDVVVGYGQTGEPVFLKDIAKVSETLKEVRSRVRIDGTGGVMLVITKNSGANTVLVAREAKEMLESLKPNLDKELKFNLALDFSSIIELMAQRSAVNILTGGVLAMLLILFFLRNLRPTLAIGIAIPLSVLTTFIALQLVGYTLNLITMGGLALGVGMLVDNAVVVIENIFRHLEDGRSPFDAARVGTSEVGTAIIASTLTTIAVFFPMMLAKGVSGAFSRGLATSVSFALISSLFIALTIIPMLATWLFKQKESYDETWIRLGDDKFSRFRDFYKRMLRKALERRKYVLIGIFLLFVLSIVIATMLGTEFLPDTDHSLIFLKLTMPVGTNLEETDRIIRYVENQSLKDPHVMSTLVNVGVSELNTQNSSTGFNPAGSYEATMWSYLVTSSEREFSDNEILERWRRSFPNLQRGKIQFIDVASISMMGGSNQKPIEFDIYGRNLKILRELADKVKGAIMNIEGIRDVEISLEESKPEIKLVIKKEEAARLGLTSYEISRQVQTYTIGTVVSRIMLQGEEREIRVRLREQDRNSVEQLKRLPIVTSTGRKVYLSQLASFELAYGAVRIDRQNQVRKASVTANYVHRDLGGIVNEIEERTRFITGSLPDGYFHRMAGEYQDMQEAFKAMAFAMIISIILVYAVMASQFESLKYPFIIMFTIPLATIGVVIFLALSGKHLSLPAVMGFIMLGGIVVNNGIVLVDYINQLLSRGFERLDSVLEAAAVRLRPILITALSTIFGMLPMALATSEGSEIRGPMAIALIGGLLASTFLTLFVVPILYTYFSHIQPPCPSRKRKIKK